MWSAKSDIADIYLSGKTLAIRANDSLTLDLLGDDWVSPLQSSLAELPNRRWRVWLGGRRCGLHLCDPIGGVRNIEEAETALGASLSLDGRAVSVRLASWAAASGPWSALTTEIGLIERLMSTMEECAGHVQSVRPWWTMLSGGDSTGVAMCDDEAITYWRVNEQGVVTSAATLWAAEDQQPASLQRLRVGGALKAWRLALDASAGLAQVLVAPLPDEETDAAA